MPGTCIIDVVLDQEAIIASPIQTLPPRVYDPTIRQTDGAAVSVAPSVGTSKEQKRVSPTPSHAVRQEAGRPGEQCAESPNKAFKLASSSSFSSENLSHP